MTHKPIKYGRGKVWAQRAFSGIKTERKETKPAPEPKWTAEELRGSGFYSSGREGWYE